MNTASRMEATSEPDCINLSQESYSQLVSRLPELRCTRRVRVDDLSCADFHLVVFLSRNRGDQSSFVRRGTWISKGKAPLNVISSIRYFVSLTFRLFSN